MFYHMRCTNRKRLIEVSVKSIFLKAAGKKMAHKMTHLFPLFKIICYLVMQQAVIAIPGVIFLNGFESMLLKQHCSWSMYFLRFVPVISNNFSTSTLFLLLGWHLKNGVEIKGKAFGELWVKLFDWCEIIDSRPQSRSVVSQMDADV